MSSGVALFFGIFIGIVISFLTWILTKKQTDPSQRPERKLNDEIRKKIVDEIRSDSDRALAERILRKLSGDK